MTKEVEDLLQRHKDIQGTRSQWMQHWQELAEMLLPNRADFTVSLTTGSSRTNWLYDSTPMMNRRALTATLYGLLIPRTTPWFFVRAEDDDLNDDDEAKGWMEDAESRMRKAFYNRHARFVQRSREATDDLVTFGTGNLFIGTSQELNRLLFRSFHLKNFTICENADGIVDTYFVEEELTARQAAQRFGEDKLGDKVKEALREDAHGKNRDSKFKFVWVVMPREDRKGAGSRNMPFASLYIDVESEHMIDESGFWEFPTSVQRWDTSSGEMYGRSPGMVALPDSQTLQEMGKTILTAGQRVVDPPMFAASDSLMSAPRTWPGGITYFDAEAARELGGSLPLQALDTRANLPIGREMQNDIRQQIERAFFKNVFNMPVDGPQMTATEILERKDEFLREMAPTLGQLEDDGPAMMVERVFHIMRRAGQFAPIPDVLKQRNLKFTFMSPVDRARRQIEVAGMGRAFEILGPLAQAQPEILDNLDGDEITRDMPETFGFPSTWFRSREDVEAVREARAQEAQAQQSMEDLMAGAEVTEKVVPLFQKQAA